ncbi:LmbE family N-acetylglucosaminyl deacetylase [Modicisalibacter xianhensis]|uniref:LmbE family N-acetylglucosaminyl deacetylase n=1 Tax=Modicisalibacter xianhensis TaxID=442341 RepID=A0A4R8FZ38_9GAMM|nr:PIG-L family deacetylase [Halomonas xianhensis]TDX32347.1 LmbE family N-acetylglucosaminyl deacetylase [Halomonas xianhensis]
MNEDAQQARQIVGAGTPAEAWEAWSGLAALPVVNAGSLVGEKGRAVIVAPHPDDEILGCGGLLRQLAALGRDLLLISVTDGTGSHPGSMLWPPERLAQERPKESADALRLMGLASVPVLRAGFIDTRVADDEAALTAWMNDVLRPGDTVITTWRGDGHPDHEATGRACARAALAMSCRMIEMPIWAWHWAVPGDSRIPWASAARLALSEEDLACKRAAMTAHVSQVTSDADTGAGPVLTPHTLQRLLRSDEVLFL